MVVTELLLVITYDDLGLADERRRFAKIISPPSVSINEDEIAAMVHKTRKNVLLYEYVYSQ